MPCYEVRTVSVEFHAKHRDLLEAALKALGWTFQQADFGDILVVGRPNDWDPFTIDLNTSRATINDRQQDALNALKREYSRQCVRQVAKQNRWTVSQTSATQGVFIRA